MKILTVYYSRTGNTEKLAKVLIDELQSRGHDVVFERIEVVKKRSKWVLLSSHIYHYPILALCLLNSSVRRWWLERYRQVEHDIHALAYPDVSEFDLVCIGGPKWCYISYPVAGYIKRINGLYNKKVAGFATFGGASFEVFELELLFKPFKDRVEKLGATLVATLGLSSNFHEFFAIYIFRLLSWIILRRPVKSFTVDSEYGSEKIREFCDSIGQ